MKTRPLLLTGFLLWTAGSSVVNAGMSDYLDTVKKALDSPEQAASGVNLTDAEMVSGLKEALDEGVQFAVRKLGKQGGFLDNSKVRIPMPESLSWVEKSLRAVGQDKLADDFVATMNHAAEQAVPEAAPVFADAIREMSVEDAQGILSGPDDAATQYFRDKTSTQLTEKMRPIVEQATARTGVTSAYKSMTASAGGMTSMLSDDATDLDGYVTSKTLDGLFLMIAREEKKIRKNPLGQGSELLEKVFGAYQ